MPSTLVFPDGVRLPRPDEIPGPSPDRELAWARIQSACIHPGFVVSEAANPGFTFYGEANVDAPKIWELFRDLVQGLLGQWGTLVMSRIDDEPTPVGAAEVPRILGLLGTHRYQLANDGFLQFGLVSQDDERIAEVFVTPTKHLQLWFEDVTTLRSTMLKHGVPEAEALEFIDQYPRTTIRLPAESVSFPDADDLIRHLEEAIVRLKDA